MAIFIDFEVGVVGEDQDEEVSDNSESLFSFIDGNVQTNDENFCRSFDHVETDINEILQKKYENGLQKIENFDDISNLWQSSEEKLEVHDFKNSEQRVDQFNETLYPKVYEDEQHTFIKVIYTW